MTRAIATALICISLAACDAPPSLNEDRLITDTGPEALRLEALAFADEFLALLDRGATSESYPFLAEFLKGQVDEAKWVSTIGTLRAAAGPLEGRTRLGYGYSKEIAGAPRGSYFILQYKSTFDRVAWNERLVVGEAGSGWSVAGYALTK